MRRPRETLLWLAAGLVAVAWVAWAYPRALPFAPADWHVSRPEAEDLALEQLRGLGGIPDDAYVVTHLQGDAVLERRLLLAGETADSQALAESRLGRGVLFWEVLVYPPGALPRDWTLRARIGTSGEVRSLQLNDPGGGEGSALSPEESRRRADQVLLAQGLTLGDFAEPEQSSRRDAGRTDLTFRYLARDQVLGEALPYGVQVSFLGDRLAGFGTWYDLPGSQALQADLQPALFVDFGRIAVVLVLLVVVAVAFMRRYHEGEVGVRAGLKLFAFALGSGIVVLALSSRGLSQGAANLFVFSRQQMTWVVGVQLLAFSFFPLALVSFLSWSVGESFCRERWGAKLAAVDALLRRRWANATVARSSLVGLAAGLVLAGLWLLGTLVLRPVAAFPQATTLYGLAANSWLGLAQAGFALVSVLYHELFGRLFLVPLLVPRLGAWAGGALAALAGCVLLAPPLAVLPVVWSVPLGFAGSAALVALFLRYDLLTTLLAAFTSTSVLAAWPLLAAEDPWMQVSGAVPLLVAVAPLAASLRHLGGEEVVYRYDDVPPHVRRIAERERQRVELETARGIQSSILPDLPPAVAGVEIAHAYLPATEVGGDFYDVLSLEDGRLAVAVGDVAGHGVSSGLIMSMAKSALAVQVAYDPEVERVFATLNRMVFRSAGRRLLATMCYALVDPRARRLTFACAGHLFPYRVSPGGRVKGLESVAYPLGVRSELQLEVRTQQIASGDSLVLFSDGLVEARPEGSEDLFGFERLEASLATHSGGAAEALCYGLLDDVARFVGRSPQEDDRTVLVLRMP